MILWIRTGLVVLAGLSLSGWMSLVGAKENISARDVQTSCLVPEVPSLEQISVTWTGDCTGGMASGVGSVFAFSRGELRYILRAQFIEGRLTRQDQFRLCSGTSCVDQVAAAVVREHAQLALARQTQSDNAALAAPVPAVSVPAPVVPASGAAAGATEIRAEDAIYIGNFVADRGTGKLSGSGRAEFFDGRVFIGRLENGLKVGHGTYVWTNGQRYVGNWRNDLQDGSGEWTTPEGDRYVGDFRLGNREGAGVMTYANKMEYSGEWVANQPSGMGTLTYKDGSRYAGQLRDGMRDGKGLAEWNNGQRYDGHWRRDRKEGIGSMRFPDGATYEGPWKDDRATGNARMEFASGDTYVGEVMDGLPHGKGLYKWGSGDQFEGEFAAGEPTVNGLITFHITETPATTATTTSVEPEVTPVATAQAASKNLAGPTLLSKATLCGRGYNSARTASALRRFMEAFPEDECGRHSLARQKIAAFEDSDRKRTNSQEERAAQAQALVGMVVAYRQEYPYCVTGSGSSCLSVVYYFEVKGKIKAVDLARESVQLLVMGVTLLGNEKGAPAQLFAEGRTSAVDAFRSQVMGTTQRKTRADVGLAF